MTPITKLRPADDSTGAIREALNRIATERAETEQEITAAGEVRADALHNGTPADIAKAEDTARKLTLHTEQLDALAARLQPMLEAAETADDLAAYDAARVVLDEKIARCTAWKNGRYLELVAEVREYATLESEVIGDAARLCIMTAARQKLRPDAVGPLTAALPKGWHRGDVPGMPLGFTIKLPNIQPGPSLWFQQHSPIVPPNLEQYR
jgi:hypothetical protein